MVALIPALRKPKQDYEFKASLGYIETWTVGMAQVQ
jgi:hypothetical protein